MTTETALTDMTETQRLIWISFMAERFPRSVGGYDIEWAWRFASSHAWSAADEGSRKALTRIAAEYGVDPATL